MSMTRIIRTGFLVACGMVLSSCSIIRGYRADGLDGPNIFSFEHHVHDTIANGKQVFRLQKPNEGVMIIRDDKIVYEKYWGDFSADRLATIFSVSKSITSLLCGIVTDEGYIQSLDDHPPFAEYAQRARNSTMKA